MSSASHAEVIRLEAVRKAYRMGESEFMALDGIDLAIEANEYVAIVDHWLAHFGCSQKEIEDARAAALTWTIERGSRSGRVAWQFARDHAGKLGKRTETIKPRAPRKSGR